MTEVIVEYKGKRYRLKQPLMDSCDGACSTCGDPIHWEFDLIEFLIQALCEGEVIE